MKLSKLLLSLLLVAGILITTESCERVHGCTDPVAVNYNNRASVDNGTCIYTGSVIFFTTQDYGTITININGTASLYSGYFTGGTPNCGAQGAVTVDLPPGTYVYSASSPGYTWGPTTVNVTSNVCAAVLLQ